MKKLLITIFLLFAAGTMNAQHRRIDSLIAKVNALADEHKATALLRQILAMPHGDFELLKSEKQNLVKAEASKNVFQQLLALRIIDELEFKMGNLPGALNAGLKGIRVSKESRNEGYLGAFLQLAGLVYALTGDDQKSLAYLRQAVTVATTARDTLLSVDILSNIETAYAKLKKPDSALYCARRELRLFTKFSKANKQEIESPVLGDMGEAMNSANQPDSSLKYSRQELAIEKAHNHGINPELLNVMTNSFLKKGQPDSAVKFGLESYKLLSQTKRWDVLINTCAALSKAYEGRDDKKSLYYLKALIAASDSSRLNVNSARFQLLIDRDQQYDQDLRADREKLEARVRLYLVVGAAFALMIIGIILWRNYKQQKLNNHLLNEQKEEVAAQRDNLSNTLEKLRSTQSQLIQSEKMASLGELTAGIAHEIQNPLNFVNNFSEVNREMIDELKEELKGGNVDEALVIAEDIRQNEEKINHHGKRADFIVKGMLEHSRTNTGEKQLTDMNVLCDEFLKLSYHGLRAKDKSFNAEMITHFDPKLPKVNVSQQDMGRVMLNLFNNAFYAVNQKSKTAAAYNPEVSVTTSTQNGQFTITVKDNGIGIPDAVKEKIMQPFFTTKPTGEGTGLGLSLTYDMVVKGHGGSIRVDSAEGEGSEFIITLPINS